MTEKNENKPVGGLPYFIALVAIIVADVVLLLLVITGKAPFSFTRTAPFLSGLLLGSVFALLAIRGKSSVFIHEAKHAIFSNLVGNKAKTIHVEQNSGHFEYSYNKNTAHMNALIALAPYFFPLFSLLALLMLLPFLLSAGEFRFAFLAVGVGFGLDLVLNVRDISPIQTDFSRLRGGFFFGLLYVGAVFLFFSLILLSWVAGGAPAIHELLDGGFAIVEAVLGVRV